jgi:putative oxidoreductase
MRDRAETDRAQAIHVVGPLLILGLFTRPIAFILSGEMAFAYFMVHAPRGFWGSFASVNLHAAILNCFLFLFLWQVGGRFLEP